ncbi:MAG: hypothetical protein AAF367_14710 [Pseudomonadota bacterium]
MTADRNATKSQPGQAAGDTASDELAALAARYLDMWERHMSDLARDGPVELSGISTRSKTSP